MTGEGRRCRYVSRGRSGRGNGPGLGRDGRKTRGVQEEDVGELRDGDS